MNRRCRRALFASPARLRARSAPRSLALATMLTRCRLALFASPARLRARSAPRSLALATMLTRCRLALPGALTLLTAAAIAAVAPPASATGGASELSVRDRLADRRFVVTGSRFYEVGAA